MSVIPRSTRGAGSLPIIVLSVPLAAAGEARPRRLLERAEAPEVVEARAAPVVDGEVDRPVAEALERLPEPPHADVALPAHLVEVDLDRDVLLARPGLIEHVAVRRADD